MQQKTDRVIPPVFLSILGKNITDLSFFFLNIPMPSRPLPISKSGRFRNSIHCNFIAIVMTIRVNAYNECANFHHL